MFSQYNRREKHWKNAPLDEIDPTQQTKFHPPPGYELRVTEPNSVPKIEYQYKHPLYKMGDVIWEEYPILKQVTAPVFFICNSCLEFLTIEPGKFPMKCPVTGCRYTFCSQECMRREMYFHKRECEKITKHLESNPEDNLSELLKYDIAAKIMTRLPRFLGVKVEIMGNTIDFASLNINNSTDLENFFYYQRKFVLNHRQMDNILRYFTNSITFYNTEGEYASALYLGASIFKHSCQPNAIHVHDEDMLRVIALRDIHPDEPITIAKYNVFLTHRTRTRAIRFRSGEDCSCQMCLVRDARSDYYINFMRGIVRTISRPLEHQSRLYFNDYERRFRSCIGIFDALFPGPHPFKLNILAFCLANLGRADSNYFDPQNSPRAVDNIKLLQILYNIQFFLYPQGHRSMALVTHLFPPTKVPINPIPPMTFTPDLFKVTDIPGCQPPP